MRDGRQLGDKIGPRLVDLMVRAVLATRRGLAPVEARISQAATQAIIDRAGAEVADHWRPLLAPLLSGEMGDIHPDMAAWLGRTAAGTHQWHSLGGMIGGLAQSALSEAISNAVAPVAYRINEAGPNLNLDPQTWAMGVAAGVADYGTGHTIARQQGYGGGNFGLLVDLAAAVPDAGTLGELVNRGLITADDAERWLRRAMVPAELREHLVQLRRQLLTPADAALAVLRGNMDRGTGANIAERAGMTAADFGTLVQNTGEPLGLMQLLEAYRRGIIDEPTVRRGIRESRVRDEWADTAIALRFEPMTTADAADAALRGHLTEAAAQHIAELNGLRPADWQAFYANQGNPPAPEQLLELWRRGHLTEEQVNTGLREGRTRDEWIPAMRELRYDRLTTADAIDAWQRGHISREQAVQLAEENGLDPRDVPAALANAGNPLALEQLLEAYRRGFIDEARMKTGLREGRLRDDWIGTAVQLRHSPMSTADAIEASIQGHVTKARAREIAEQNGLMPADFDPLWQTAGEPLARGELEQLYNRGIIGRAAVEQGLRESRLKDKYVGDGFQLHVRLPEPRQVVEALTDGAITREAAVRMLGDYGYSHEVITMLITLGEVRSTGPHRQLMTGQITRLYSDRIIGRGKAAELLEALHFTATSAAQLLDLADYQLQQRILDSGIAAIRSHYLAGRIDHVQAAADLHALQLPASASETYLRVWGVDRLAHPKQLTEAQIVKAHTMGLFTPAGQQGTPAGEQANDDIAAARLEQLGYSPDDAQLLLAGA